MIYANCKGSKQPAHPRSLLRTLLFTHSTSPKESIGRVRLGASCFTSHNEKLFNRKKRVEKGFHVKNREVLHFS